MGFISRDSTLKRLKLEEKIDKVMVSKPVEDKQRNAWIG